LEVGYAFKNEMATYLALFRGINMGGHGRLPMKALASLLEEMGFTNIRTYIQSGNVIFTTGSRNRDKLASDISQAILQGFGFSPKVMLLTAVELRNAIALNPFPSDDGKALHFLFLEEHPAKPNLKRLRDLKTDSEDFRLGDKLFYLYAPEGVGRSKLAMNAERCLGVATTGRNWNTVSVLASMLEDKEGTIK
jgi:uncharacterized protein (DUF1697 family)